MRQSKTLGKPVVWDFGHLMLCLIKLNLTHPARERDNCNGAWMNANRLVNPQFHLFSSG